MLFAVRDENGRVTAVTNNPTSPDQQQIPELELIDFLSKSSDFSSFKRLLTHLDTGTIRVLEDLIDLLIEKNVIMFTDLPMEAQNKLGERKLIRRHLHDSPPIIDDEEDIL